MRHSASSRVASMAKAGEGGHERVAEHARGVQLLERRPDVVPLLVIQGVDDHGVRARTDGPYDLGPPFTMSDTRPGAPVSSLRTTPIPCSVMNARKK